MSKSGAKIKVLDPVGQPSGIFGSRTDPAMSWAIHDPVNQPRDTAERLSHLQMAPRLDKLEGRTVFLVDTGFAGAKDFIEELDAWFKENRPAIKIEVRHKKTGMFTDEPELWKEIKQNGDAAILGVGG
jgi:hypothetical protein